MYRIRILFRRLWLHGRSFALKSYVAYVAAPWVMARFYAAWVTYQQDSVYRTRLTLFGFKYALDTFVESDVTRKYLLSERIKQEPMLKWQIMFLPWSIPKPDILDTALASGLLD